jgi:hypothetical protein
VKVIYPKYSQLYQFFDVKYISNEDIEPWSKRKDLTVIIKLDEFKKFVETRLTERMKEELGYISFFPIEANYYKLVKEAQIRELNRCGINSTTITAEGIDLTKDVLIDLVYTKYVYAYGKNLHLLEEKFKEMLRQ